MLANSSKAISCLTLPQYHPLLYLLPKHVHCVSMHYLSLAAWVIETEVFISEGFFHFF